MQLLVLASAVALLSTTVLGAPTKSTTKTVTKTITKTVKPTTVSVTSTTTATTTTTSIETVGPMETTVGFGADPFSYGVEYGTGDVHLVDNDPSNAHTGASYLYMDVDESSKSSVHYDPTAYASASQTVPSGQQLTVTGWAKQLSTLGNCGIYIEIDQFLGQPYENNDASSAVLQLTAAYQQLSLTWTSQTAQYSADISFNVNCGSANGTTGALLDDIVVAYTSS